MISRTEQEKRFGSMALVTKGSTSTAKSTAKEKLSSQTAATMKGTSETMTSKVAPFYEV